MTVTPESAMGAGQLPILWVGAVALLLLASVSACVPALSARSPYLTTAGSLLTLAFGAAILATGAGVSMTAGYVLSFTPFAFRYDALSGAFLLALGVSGAAAAFSTIGRPPRSTAEGAAFPLFLGSILIVLGASNGFSFLLAWEAMALLSAFLVVGLHPNRAVVSAGNIYLALTHVATAAILIAFAVMAGAAASATVTATGPATAAASVMDFATWRAVAPGISEATRNLVLVLLCIGFATKAGAMPFHVWLPRAHPVAPSHVSAVMSGAMIKVGIYGLIRLCIDVVGGAPEWLGLIVLAVGAISAVLGALYALMQQDLKRLLAFSSIENVGIVLIGVGASMVLESHGAHELAALALAAAILHSINHAVFKTLLFLGAGAVLHATGLRDMNHLGGLGRKMPITLLVFGVGAAAIAGLPPLNGFASEWLTFQALLGATAGATAGAAAGAGAGAGAAIARAEAVAVIGLLALTVALSVAAFVKATGITFLGLPRIAAAGAAHEATLPARVAMGALAATCVVLGVAAGPLISNLTGVARAALHSPAGHAAGDALLPAVTAAPRGEGVATYAAPVVALLVVAAILGLAAFAVIGRATNAARATGPATNPATGPAANPAEPRRVDTWACGIAPKPAFQYTATSYSQLVRLFFRRVLVPERTVEVQYHEGTAFPSSIRYKSRITMLFEERLLRPAHELSLRSANFVRKLQGGAIQLYIAYSVIAVLLLMMWARWS